MTQLARIRRSRQVAKHALTLYAIEPVSLSLLVAHCHNTTFAITGPDGDRYVLHMLQPVEGTMSQAQSRARVESELWWLDRVRTDLNLSVPVAVHTPDGEGVVGVAVEGMELPLLCMLFDRI